MSRSLAPYTAEDTHFRKVAAAIPEVISACKLAVEHATPVTMAVLCQALKELPISEVASHLELK